MILLLDVLWFLLLGWFLVRALGRDLARLTQVCLAIGLGIGAISVCFFLELETGVPSFLFEVLVLAAAAAVSWRTGWRSPRVRTKTPASPTDRWLGAALTAVLAAGACRFVAQVTSEPHGGWDAWAIWNLHARFLVSPHWRDLFSPTIFWTNPDYPLLLPGSIARIWSTLGEPDQTVPHAVAFLFTFGCIGLLGGAVAALKGRTQGLVAALFLAATPFFVLHGAALYADVPLSFFILAATALLVLQDRAWPGERGLSLLAGLCAAMAAWTKNEGLLLVALIVPIRALAAWRWHGLKVAAKQAAWFGAGVAPVLALVLFFLFTLAPPNAHLNFPTPAPLSSLLTDPHRWGVVLVELLKGMASFGGFRVGIPLVLVAYLGFVGLDLKKDRTRLPAGFALVLLMLAGYCVICVMAPFEIRVRMAHSLNRILLQLWPATLFLVFQAARPPQEGPWWRAIARTAPANRRESW